MDFDLVVRVAVEQIASDIFFKEGNRPCLKVRGRIGALDLAPLTAEDTKQIAYDMMSEEQIRRFERTHEMDMGITITGLTRFRVNIHQQRGSIGVVMRLIPLEVPTIDELGLPSVLKDLCKRNQGLVLVTGPTGSGKSTTLAAMLDEINIKQPVHIVTIEDPLEYVHHDKRGIVTQREVGIDTESFLAALKTVVRQAPNIILIGEMRDVETMHAALLAAETGHLVFSTVHTRSASETVDRILNMFPPHEKVQISQRISQSLQGVVSQKLVRTADGTARMAAIEIMVVTPTVQKYIEEVRLGELYDAIAEGEFWGMQTMNQVLNRYYKQGLITEEVALANAGNVTELRQMLRRQE